MNRVFLIILVPVLALILSGCTKKTQVTPSVVCDESKGCPFSTNAVPLPTGESTVRTFLTLISEKRIPEAVSMLSVSANPDESTKQAWGVNFNSIKKLEIKKIEGSGNTFKVTLNLQVDKPGEYNWENGENLRWITVTKTSDIWKIDSINTGP